MILPLQEHVLSYSMYLCVTGIFFDMYAYLYLCTVYMYFACYWRNKKRAIICITENEQFTSSCKWNYQGSYSNQHCYSVCYEQNHSNHLHYALPELTFLKPHHN